jgi:phospholipid-binding lipoprotein MlaA
MRFETGTLLFKSVTLLFLAGSVALTGCAVHGRGAALEAVANGTSASLDPSSVDDAAARPASEHAEAANAEDYDPWERFNERMFAFNHKLDRVVVKPVAKAWTKIAPEPVRNGIANVFRNVGMPRRFVNNLFQLKFTGAAQELAGLVINSTVGVGGLVDVMKEADLRPPDAEDAGQTLAVYGIGPGPYLVLPFFSPSTVRDSIGSGIDGLLDPLGYVMPFVGSVAKRVVTIVNDRSANLETFEAVEESVVDLYSAVRNGYLQRRERAIKE